jgi:HEAT repeat protein
LNDAAALDRIKPYCTSGNRRVYRNTAIASYAKIAKNLDEESARRRAAEFLYPSLDDWHLRTRGAAIDALATIGAPSSVEPLRRVASTDPVAEVREKARKAADRISADVAKPSAGSNAADIEDLKRRLESLERELEAAKKQLSPPPSENAGSE